jgi:hypothetical protein
VTSLFDDPAFSAEHERLKKELILPLYYSACELGIEFERDEWPRLKMIVRDKLDDFWRQRNFKKRYGVSAKDYFSIGRHQHTQ